MTTVSNTKALPLSFPGVTLCNRNFVHCGNLYKHIVDIENPKLLIQLCTIYVTGKCGISLQINDQFRQVQLNCIFDG